MIPNHKYYLGLAFQQAEKNLGKTKSNPSVGTVVVKNNSVISSGVTSINGRPHAEYNALINTKKIFGASLYTTLEPCTHYGLTPPCVNVIIKKKIKNVYYAYDDPDPRTYKKAKVILKKKKIKTKKIKINNFKNFYRSYYLNKKFKLPLISAKIAISKDYFTISKKNKWITNDRSRKTTHLLRSESDCIFSTSKSINKDNSLLNCRIEGLNTNKPDLFIIDLNLKLKKNLAVINMAKKRTTFLVTKKENRKKLGFFKKKGFKFIFVESLITNDDFNNMFHHIYSLGYSRALFETGVTFLNTLINLKLVNILYVFQNSANLKIDGSNNATPIYLKKIKLNRRIKTNLNNDNLFKIEL